MRDVFLSKSHSSVWVAAGQGRGRGKGRGCVLAITSQVTYMASGQDACCRPWHAEAALLDSGSKGDSSLMLEEVPRFPPEHLLLLPSFLSSVILW